MALQSAIGMSGQLTNRVIKGEVKADFGWKIKNALRPNYLQGLAGVGVAKVATKLFPLTIGVSELEIRKYNAQNNQWIDYGVVGRKVVTNLGAELIVDSFQNTFDLSTLVQHGLGSGSTAEAAGDTDLVTPFTTELNPDSTRAAGTSTEQAGNPNVWESVATNSFDSVVIVREHGMFNQTATSSGSLLDRTVFAEINLSAGDSLQSTYRLTINAGS